MQPVEEVFFLANWSRMVTYDFGHVAAAFGKSPTRAHALVTSPLEPEFERLAAPGVTFESLPLHRGRLRLGDALRSMRRIHQLAVEHPDGVFSVFALPNHLLGGIPLGLLGRRTVYFVTGMGSLFGSDQPVFRLARLAATPVLRRIWSARNALVITQNAEDLEILVRDIGVPRDRITVVPGCGADPEEYPFFEHFVPKPEKVILVPARIVLAKGVREAITASAILSERGVNHEMWFSGGIDRGHPCTTDESQLKELAKGSPGVRFIGWQPHVRPLLEHCDVVCLPTKYREGLPKALVEAAASGRPIVTTDTIGPREIVQHNRTGLLVPKGDAHALADALERVLRDDTLADRLRREAYREFLARHTRVENLRQTLRVFERLGRFQVEIPEAQVVPPEASQELQISSDDAIGSYGPVPG